MRDAATLLLLLFRRGGWLPAVVVAVHFYLARVLKIYGPHPWLDMPMHFVGGIAIAFFIDRSIDVFVTRGSLRPSDGATKDLLVVSLTATAAMFWEFFEFLSDRLGWSRAQTALDDTMLDMALGLGGGIVFVVAARIVGRHQRGDP